MNNWERWGKRFVRGFVLIAGYTLARSIAEITLDFGQRGVLGGVAMGLFYIYAHAWRKDLTEE